MNEDYCLWVGDVDPTKDEFLILNLFHFYNVHPSYIKLVKNPYNNSLNHCFIYFKNIYEANRALNQLNGKQILNTPNKFRLNWANYISSETKTIFVGNLNPLVDDITLFNFFKSKYSSVLKAKVIRDNNGQSKKYGFVTFKKGSDYRKSLIGMNLALFEGNKIRIKEYKKDESKDKNENDGKEEDEDENENEEDDKNNQQNIKFRTNSQLELNNTISNSSYDYIKLLNMNNLNYSNFLPISNFTNKFNRISNVNPVNCVNFGVNYNSSIVNSNNNLFNQNKYSNKYDENNNNFNFNNSVNDNKKCDICISNKINDKNNINTENKNNDSINNINTNNINIMSKGNKNDNIINNNVCNKNNNISNDNKNDSIINNKISKNTISEIPKLEILEKYDEKTLEGKIKENLNKMLDHYKKNYKISGNNIVSKLILFIIFI